MKINIQIMFFTGCVALKNFGLMLGIEILLPN